MEYVAKRSVSLPTAEMLELEFHLMDVQPGIKLEDFLTDLATRWLKIDKERLALRKNGHSIRGVQWKNVFLPDGTTLRTSYLGTIDFAKVAGNRILTEDNDSVTPSLFANRHTKGRNAWRFVWLRFPGDDYWVRADDYRSRMGRMATKAV
jgi:hypothetical protein